MISINFDFFPLNMSHKNARLILQKFSPGSNLPAEGSKLIVCVPLSGTVTFENIGGFFNISAESMGQS